MIRTESGRATAWRLNLEQIPDTAELIALLEPAERQRAESYTHADGRRRYIACRAALRLLLARRLDEEPVKLRLETDAHGKPHLAGRPRGISFNLSHSGGLALIALADGPSIGVDVEAWRPARANTAIARRCFAPAEFARWQALPEAQRTAHFFALWTRKEAFAKAVGKGIAIGLERIVFTAQGNLAAVPPGCGNPQDWLVRDLRVGEGYSASLAMGQPVGHIETKDFGREDWARRACAGLPAAIDSETTRVL